MLKRILKEMIKGLLWLLDPDHRETNHISDNVKKFTHVEPVDFQSDFGHASKAFRTVPYEIWSLKTTGYSLTAADKHRVIDEHGSPVWLEDLRVGDRIRTQDGVQTVIECRPLDIRLHTYCLQVDTVDKEDPNNHLFYTDGILSHNTTCSGGYLLWKAMFTDDATILIVANNFNGALEIMNRARYAYECLPDFLRPGVKEYNKGSIAFDNGSRIISRATSTDAARGLAITLLYCMSGENIVTVRNKTTGFVESVCISDLNDRLRAPSRDIIAVQTTALDSINPLMEGYTIETDYRLISNGQEYVYDFVVPQLRICVESEIDATRSQAIYKNRSFLTFQKDNLSGIEHYIRTYEQPDQYLINTEYDILTPTGWHNFKGLMDSGVQPLIRIEFSDRTHTEVTTSHPFYVDGTKVESGDLIVGDAVDTRTGTTLVSSVSQQSEGVVYDIVEVGDPNHQFFLNNNLITKNCDEFAFLRSASLGEQFWKAVYPTLSTGGSCIITSTPKSDEDQFAQIWKKAIDNTDEAGNPTYTGVGKNGFFPIKVSWEEHPDRDEKWAQEERERIGEAQFLQEYCCEFVSNDLTLIDPLFLSKMPYIEPQFFVGQVRWFKDPEPNKTYLAALDPSQGTGGDFASIQVFELPGMVQVAEWKHNRVSMKDQIVILKNILHFLDEEIRAFGSQSGEPQLYWTVEGNSLGQASLQVIEHTGEEKFPGMLISEKRRRGNSRVRSKGLITSSPNKKAACTYMKNLIETGRMIVNSRELLREFKTFVSYGNSAAAKPGSHDDLVMAALLCVRMLGQVTNYDDTFAELQEGISDDDLGPSQPMAMII